MASILYYGCIKDTPHRWLNLDALCSLLLPQEEIGMIRYFTARVSARPGNMDAPTRQDTHLRALATLPRISVHFGQFSTHKKWMALAYPPPRGPSKVQVLKTEEKGSDVNLASYALLDGFKQRYDTAVIVSNDSDLCEPVAMIRHELGLRVGIINPHPPRRRSRALSQHVTFFKQIRVKALAASQFDDDLVDSVGRFRKPKQW